MKNFFKNIWDKKTLLVFVVLLVILLPSALAKPATASTKTILTEIAIDRKNDEYSIIATQFDAKSENGTEIVESGQNVQEIVKKIENSTEKKVSFAHCKQITVGKDIPDENTPELLKYFLLDNEIHNSIILRFEKDGRKISLEEYFKSVYKS